MLHYSRWFFFSVLGSVVVAALFLLPNFFPRATVQNWPSWLPSQQMVLGLDLQGGVALLYEIDREEYQTTRIRQLTSDIRAALIENPRILYTNLGVVPQGVQVRITDPNQIEDARTRLQALRNPLSSGILGGGSNYEFDFTIGADGLARFTFSEAGLETRMRQIVAQSIEVIDRRINQLGTLEPSIQGQGVDRILVEAPGLDDPNRLKDLVGQTAQMTFHLVIGSGPLGTPVEAGQIWVPAEDNPTQGYVLEENALLRGEQIVDAQTTTHPQGAGWVVNFRLNASGAREFGAVTQSNIGRQFAIVLDNQVVSAPAIQSAILGGAGYIEGNFTVQSANDLAILLRAGALPAKLTIVEERTVGPSLGQDSIRAGIIAVVVAIIFIAAFMILCYGLLGSFAVLALVGQVIIMMAILSVLGAALTLPGIAGIVLTMALAVDANVLIYERMREEARAGKSVVAALDQGFRRAIATIVDAHLTALIAAFALFWLGSGPIRGFAITLGIGILSTLFTAYLITRLIVAVWVKHWRPKTVPL